MEHGVGGAVVEENGVAWSWLVNRRRKRNGVWIRKFQEKLCHVYFHGRKVCFFLKNIFILF
jgi:hypothetical protein